MAPPVVDPPTSTPNPTTRWGTHRVDATALRRHDHAPLRRCCRDDAAGTLLFAWSVEQTAGQQAAPGAIPTGGTRRGRDCSPGACEVRRAVGNVVVGRGAAFLVVALTMCQLPAS